MQTLTPNLIAVHMDDHSPMIATGHLLSLSLFCRRELYNLIYGAGLSGDAEFIGFSGYV